MSSNTSDIDLRDSRLAELVAELTGCDENGALHALREQDSRDGDALQRVASAIVAVERPAPDGLRVAGYRRADWPALAPR